MTFRIKTKRFDQIWRAVALASGRPQEGVLFERHDNGFRLVSVCNQRVHFVDFGQNDDLPSAQCLASIVPPTVDCRSEYTEVDRLGTVNGEYIASIEHHSRFPAYRDVLPTSGQRGGECDVDPRYLRQAMRVHGAIGSKRLTFVGHGLTRSLELRSKSGDIEAVTIIMPLRRSK